MPAVSVNVTDDGVSQTGKHMSFFVFLTATNLSN